MVFSSIIFLFLFLPVVLLFYHLTPNRFKNLVLLIASLFFYTWGEGVIVILLLLSSVIDYSCGLIIEKGKRRLGLMISIFANLSFLGAFKYLNFTFDNFNTLLEFFGWQNSFFADFPTIALPIGISFFTFQTMSYTIDVYRGDVKANHDFIAFAAYVTMFPQLVAGPIVRYIDINEQLISKNISIDNFAIGVERFIIGLAKKVLIANTFAVIADDIFSQNITDISTGHAWIGIIAYSLQIYYDFSGYSDMAIGLGKMFGFDFLENFNYPYISRSIKEFWRRWHISLSSWFRDYVYISLGGNRISNRRTYINLFIVFFVTGLWHGASWSFVIWGLFHGIFIVFERLGADTKIAALSRPLQHLYALIVVIVGWVFFRVEKLGDALLYLKQMFWLSFGDPVLNSYFNFFHFNLNNLFFFIIAIAFSTPLYRHIDNVLLQPRFLLIRIFFFLSILFLSIVFLSVDSYNPFIYFRF